MQITAIEPRRKGLSAVYIDGEFAMKLDTQTLLENRADVGREISDEELKKLIELSNERRAKEKAVERMEELGLVNDEQFAAAYARKLLLEKKMTRRTAAFELSRKGIDRETADRVLEEIEVDYRDNIRAVIEKKYRNIQDEKIRRRAVAALQRLGYGWEDIKSVLEEFNEKEVL